MWCSKIFAAKNRGDAERLKILDVHGSVQAVTTEVRARILFPKLGNELRCEPRGRVHGQIDGDETGIGNRSPIERLPGKVEQDDGVATLPQPGRRRRQPERLPPQLVGRNENDVHAPTSIAARRSDSISVIIED